MIRLSFLIALMALLLGLAVAQAPGGQPAVVKLLSVQSTKVLYDVGEPIAGSVVVKNVTASSVTVTVRAWLAWELEAASKPMEVKLAIAPGKDATATFNFAHSPARYGHALKAQVLLNGQVVAAGEDYFNVCDNYWNVALISGIGPGSGLDPGNIARMRNDYYNCFEIMFWAPDDFLGLTPDTDAWWSGQARYAEAKTGVVDFPHWGKVYGLKEGIALAHSYGIKAVTYAKLTGGGTYGTEMARRHPEMVWQNGGTLSVIARRSRPNGMTAASTGCCGLGAGELQHERSEGGGDRHQSAGRLRRPCSAGTARAGTAPSRCAREVLRPDGQERGEAHRRAGGRAQRRQHAPHQGCTITKCTPRFVYGYNWTQGNWGQSLATNPRESSELCRGGGLIMNEYINQADGVQHPLHRWDVYGPSVADDVERIKTTRRLLRPDPELGGHGRRLLYQHLRLRRRRPSLLPPPVGRIHHPLLGVLLG